MARRRLLTLLAGLGAAVALSIGPATAADLTDPVEDTVDTVEDAADDTLSDDSDDGDGADAGDDGPVDDALDTVDETVADTTKAVDDVVNDPDEPTDDRGDDLGPGKDLEQRPDEPADRDDGNQRERDRSDRRAARDERRPAASLFTDLSSGVSIADLRGQIQRGLSPSTLRTGFAGMDLGSVRAPDRDALLLAPEVAAREEDVARSGVAEHDGVTPRDDGSTLAVPASSDQPVDAPAPLQALAALSVLGAGVVWRLVRDDLVRG